MCELCRSIESEMLQAGAVTASGVPVISGSAAAVRTPDVLQAGWLPAGASSEAVGVYSLLSENSLEWRVWDESITYLDALIDKDFSYSSFQASSISVSNQSLGSPQILGNADFFDNDVNNGIFDIGMNHASIALTADYFNYDYMSYYQFIAQHELGHALGLKHPFDRFSGSGPANESITTTESVMAYEGGPNTFTPLDLAALIEINGIEDDWQGNEAPVFRFYNANTGGHFFTASSEEAEFVATTLYDFFTFEGTAFYADGTNPANTEAIYRFYNTQAGGHFFTADEAERDFVINQLSPTFTYEGVGFYASADTGDAVHRFYNEAAGGHFFTSDAEEFNFVLNNLSSNFIYEGVGFYA